MKPVAETISDASATTRKLGDRLASFVPSPARRIGLAYSRFVLSMKIALPAAATGLLLLVALWSQIQGGEQRFGMPKVVVRPDDLENLRMEAPRFVGLDSRNQPFLVTARLAMQTTPGGPSTELEEPKGDIALANGTWIAMEARRGIYDHRAETLELKEGVTVFQDQGYQLETRSARFLFRPGDVEGDEPVRGHSQDFEMDGAGFRIESKGARIHLRGQSRIVFYPRRATGPATPAKARP
jgi:lipopolysaccharide export system protein LptC